MSDERSGEQNQETPKEKKSTEKSTSDPWTESNEVSDPGTEIKKAAEEYAAKKESSGKEKSKEARSDNEQALEPEKEWQHDLINRLAFSSLNEQRRARRWSIFFKSLVFVYLFVILMLYFPDEGADLHIGNHTGLVELNGVIADDTFANADAIITGLRNAYEDKSSKGIILRINSPGGSPVQASYVYDEIVRLREVYPNKPLYAVVTDVCASAAYYIAAASDAIYADKGSIVGSIGVLMDGYGFTEAMKKLGVERRLLTAGENKGFLDPFSPISNRHKIHMQSLLDNIHEQFITVVKEGRGDRLSNDPDIFSGLFWTGEKSVGLGLVDGLGSAGYVARELIGEEKIVDYTPRPSYLDRFAERIGVAMANTFQSMFFGPSVR